MRIGHICVVHSNLLAHSVHFSQVSSNICCSLLFDKGGQIVSIVYLFPVGIEVFPCFEKAASNLSYHGGSIVAAGEHHTVV